MGVESSGLNLLYSSCLYEEVVREGDMVLLENCRLIGKTEVIML